MVQNSYNTAAEQGLSVTDQRHRLMLAWIADPKFFGREQPFLTNAFNDGSWRECSPWAAAGLRM